MQQGFSASPVLDRMPHVALHPEPHVHTYPSATPGELATKGALGVTKAKPAELTKEQKNILLMRGFHYDFMLPGALEMAGGLGGFVLGGAARKLNWQRAGAVVGMTLKAPVEALRTTTLSTVFHLPANFMEAVAHEAERAGEKTAGWGKAARENAELMRIDARTLESHSTEMTEDLRLSVGKRITAFEKDTTLGRKIHSALDGVMHKRVKAASAKHNVAITNAKTALTEEKTGFMKSAGDKAGKLFSRGKVVETSGMDELGAIVGKLETGTGAAHFKAISEELAGLTEKKVFTGTAKNRAGEVTKYLGKALSSAQALEDYEKAAGKSLKFIVGAFGQRAGRTPLFAALIAVGATAGVTATLMTAKAESKQAKQAFNDLSAELGTTDSSFLNAMKLEKKSHTKSGLAKTGLQVVGDVADGIMWANPHGAGMALMSAQMLPMLCDQLVPGNAALGAVVALKKHAQGELQLQSSDQVDLWKALISVRPEVAAHGGIYNRLAAADAAEMVNRKLSVSEGLKLLNDDAAFGAFSAEVSAKHKAQEAKAVPAANVSAMSQPVAALNGEDKTPTKAEAAYAATDKPGSVITAKDNATIANDNAELQGRVSGMELRRA